MNCASDLAARLSLLFREGRLAHAAPDRCASTSALSNATNRSTSHISSSSASFLGINAPSRLRASNSWTRSAASSEGRKAMISSPEGWRVKKEITSRGRADPADHVRRNPRAPRLLVSIGTILLLVATLASAQDSQFFFDANGNLQVQTAEVSAPPQILAQPQQQIAQPGELASFFVVAADTQGLTYQWRFNGTNISSATNDALLLSNVAATNEGQYSVVLVNGSGSVTSNPAMLWFDSNRNGLPDTWELTYFTNLNQQATGDFDGDGVSNLQEFLDGTNPTNSTSARYRLVVLSDAGSVVFTPNELSYTNGETVTLAATPAEAFHAWLGDVVTRSNPVALVVTTNNTIFARFTPIDFTWTNLTSGDWIDTSNWNPNLVPATNDNVFITSLVTVTNNCNADWLNFTPGTVAVWPRLTGSGTLTIHGTASFLNGNMTGSGRTIIAPGATFNLITSASFGLATRILENGGTVLWTGAGAFNVNSGAVITNRPGALFEVQNALPFITVSGDVGFDNAGTFRKSVSSGTTTFGMPLNNYGTMDLQSGTLLCNASFLNSGSVTLSAGATNRLAAGGSATGTFNAAATALVEWAAGGPTTFTLNTGRNSTAAGFTGWLKPRSPAIPTWRWRTSISPIKTPISAARGRSPSAIR